MTVVPPMNVQDAIKCVQQMRTESHQNACVQCPCDDCGAANECAGCNQVCAADAHGEPPAASAQQVPGGAHGAAGAGAGPEPVPAEPDDAAGWGDDGLAGCVRNVSCTAASPNWAVVLRRHFKVELVVCFPVFVVIQLMKRGKLCSSDGYSQKRKYVRFP
eukprot:1155608-Pelagomonas_calceolata.AAC.6